MMWFLFEMMNPKLRAAVHKSNVVVSLRRDVVNERAEFQLLGSLDSSIAMKGALIIVPPSFFLNHFLNHFKNVS